MTHRNYIVIKASGSSDYPFTEANGWTLLTEMQTNSPNSETFDPQISGAGQMGWDFGDDSRLTNDRAVSHTFLDGSTKTIKVFTKGTVTVLSVDFNSDRIIGVVDLSNALFNALTSLILNSNTGLTGVIFPPAPSAIMSAFNISSAGITGTLNMAGFARFAANTAIQLQSNPLMTGVTFASTILSGTLSALKIESCKITGTLDISMFKDFNASAQVTLNNNSLMTEVVLPATTITGNISAFHIYSTGITGVLDLTKISRFTTAANIYLHLNPNLTGVLFNSSIVGAIYSLYLYSTGITGVLDLSMFTTFAANCLIQLQSNPLMTGVTFASSAISGSIATLSISSTGIVGNLDLSKFSALSTSAQLLLNANSALTGITFAASITGTISILQANSCNLTGSIDLSMFKSFTSSATLNLSSNANLTAVTLSATATTGSARTMNFSNCAIPYLDLTNYASTINSISWVFNIQNNAISAANVNRMLVEINTIATSGFSGRSIIINGTNAAPDSTSGGYDGLTAKTALQGKGFTVTTN